MVTGGVRLSNSLIKNKVVVFIFEVLLWWWRNTTCGPLNWSALGISLFMLTTYKSCIFFNITNHKILFIIESSKLIKGDSTIAIT